MRVNIERPLINFGRLEVSMAFNHGDVKESMEGLGLTPRRADFYLNDFGVSVCADVVSRIDDGAEIKNIDAYFSAVGRKVKVTAKGGAPTSTHKAREMPSDQAAKVALNSKLKEEVGAWFRRRGTNPSDITAVVSAMAVVGVGKANVIVRFYDESLAKDAEVYCNMVYECFGPYCGGRELTFVYQDDDALVIKSTKGIRAKSIRQSDLFKAAQDYQRDMTMHTRA